MTVTAVAAGTWQLDDLTVSRLGFGAMRLTGGAVFGRGVRAAPCPRAAAGRGWLSCSRIYPVKG